MFPNKTFYIVWVFKAQSKIQICNFCLFWLLKSMDNTTINALLLFNVNLIIMLLQSKSLNKYKSWLLTFFVALAMTF